MTKPEMKAWIDNASYAQLLAKWRNAPLGDPFFQLEVGDYYHEVLLKRREEVGSDGHVAASKQIGWDNNED